MERRGRCLAERARSWFREEGNFEHLRTGGNPNCIQTIFPGALAVPHSPIVPHTPLATRSNTSSSAYAHPPRTPYTPYSAFASKQNPFDLSYGASVASTSLYAHLLDDTEDALARLYNQILRFVERDLSRIMDVAEKVSIKSVSNSREDKDVGASLMVPGIRDKGQMSSEVDGEGFEIMANVVWADIATAIIDELGGLVFSAGRPSEFRKVYY